ncbi:MAG: hypothetical protein FJW96_04325 [Actinobacteria bacterium]|nr:hypothetical protein [Actinomycetota bacterium]
MRALPVKLVRNCDDRSSTIQFVSTATNAPDPSKTHSLKSQIVWKSNIGTDRWRESDRSSQETVKRRPTSGRFAWHPSTPHHTDRTVWANAYGRLWQAEVTLTFMQVRTGPDKKVWQATRYFSKARFREIASTCEFDGGGGLERGRPER